MKLCFHCSKNFEAVDWVCPACGQAPSMVDGIPSFAPELSQVGACFDPDSYRRLTALEDKSFWFRSRNRLIIWTLGRCIPHIQHYLEVGCGTGYVLAGLARAYPETTLTGADVFTSGLSYAARRVQAASLIQMDARHIPFTEEFDAIGAFDVLEHIEDDEAVLSEIWRALRPGGIILITVPQHPFLWSEADDYACHVRRYRRGDLQAKVRNAGFLVEFQTSFVSLLLPMMAASRLAQPYKTKAQAADPMSELCLPAFADRIFEGVMEVERMLIRLGIHFPIGGSILLLARK